MRTFEYRLVPDTPVERGKGPKKRHKKKCGPCAEGDHSGYHDPILGCMDAVDKPPKDFPCTCGLTPCNNSEA